MTTLTKNIKLFREDWVSNLDIRSDKRSRDKKEPERESKNNPKMIKMEEKVEIKPYEGDIYDLK